MNVGASRASGAALAFVHADTTVPPSFAADIATALSPPEVVGGRFDVQLDDPALLLKLTGDLISWRSRISRTATGDQAIFVCADVFRRIGGFPEIEICEDLEFSRRLKREGAVACLRSRVTTSARRWRMEGTVRTILRMWSIKLMYLAGVSPARLKQMYSDAPR
jgi:rSAM/selenodomain-associated transferase 2